LAASNSEGPTAGNYYTILAATRTDGKPLLGTCSDDLAQPEPGKAKRRVIHAAPGVRKVDLYVAGTKTALINGVGFTDAPRYKEIDPAVLTDIDVRTADRKSSATKIGSINLAAGKLYTLVLMGGNRQEVTSMLIQDELVAATGS